MKSFLVEPTLRLRGVISLLGDKSIAHRSIILSAIALGKTTIKNFPTSKDCLYTIKAFKKLGVKITQNLKRGESHTITVLGRGRYGLKKPKGSIFVGDSGTTLRLILGVLAGQNFRVKLTAGESLSKRPMLRVTTPLRLMGADINARRMTHDARQEEYPPLTIKGGNLKPITYKMPVASAQVKSAILLAGLYARGRTAVIEQVKTRDHTERLLNLFKADIKLKQNKIVIEGNKELVSPGIVTIPGDISSASFFIVLATMLPDSQILIRNVNLNPLRLGIIKALKRMGADIKILASGEDFYIKYQISNIKNYEPAGDLLVKNSRLKGIVVKKEEIPSLIDELPILMVAACQAKGRTILEGVGELRVKETDRIRSMSTNLKKMGAVIRIFKDLDSEKIVIQGVKELKGAQVRSFGDHRTAMSMVVAGLLATGKTSIDDISCINKSFPDFLSLLRTLTR